MHSAVVPVLVATICGARPAYGGEERPRMEAALGMGVSRDGAGLSPARTATVPAFLVMGGFGGGVVGIDLDLFSNSAVGRFSSPDKPIDRLAASMLVVARPGAASLPGGDRWWARAARGFSLALGPGIERVDTGQRAAFRTGVRLGGHLDLPLSPPGGGELRLRLAVRRFFGPSATLPTGEVGDSDLELFGALAVVF